IQRHASASSEHEQTVPEVLELPPQLRLGLRLPTFLRRCPASAATRRRQVPSTCNFAYPTPIKRPPGTLDPGSGSFSRLRRRARSVQTPLLLRVGIGASPRR